MSIIDIDQIKATGHVTTINGLPSMSSLEIAEITGKDHSRVLKDARKDAQGVGLIRSGQN